jgi:hypothetical protein
MRIHLPDELQIVPDEIMILEKSAVAQNRTMPSKIG